MEHGLSPKMVLERVKLPSRGIVTKGFLGKNEDESLAIGGRKSRASTNVWFSMSFRGLYAFALKVLYCRAASYIQRDIM